MSITIRPSSGDSNSIAANDLVKQVEALRHLLRHADKSGEADTRVVGLHMNSPATIIVEPASPDGTRLNLGSFFDGVEAIVKRGEAPLNFERPVFDALRDLATVVGKGIRSTTIEMANRELIIDVAARKRIESVFGSETSSEGSVDGMLEAINVHSIKNTFALYPVVGPPRISCKFDDKQITDVRPALGKYVLIEGELKYRWREKFPFECKAHTISVMDDIDAQPNFADIIGLAPDATNGLASEEFTEKVRHGW